jgi:phospholipid/cholesterol/gamma-HCH transport system permease protein
LPLLTLFASTCGIVGGFLICIYILKLNPEEYINSIREHLDLKDIIGGLAKAGVFGFLLAWVGTYKGYRTRDGARGVGISATQSVVIGSTIILLINYIMSSILFEIGV